MGRTLINLRIDEDLKRDMETICNELGMNMTTAFTVFAKQVCREKRIPFEISLDPFYSISNMSALDKSIAQQKNGEIVTKTMEELAAMADE